MAGGALLEFDHVVATDPSGRTILHAVSLSVPVGAIVALVGPSGAGKSTLLRLANRLDVPASGTIRIDGVDTSSMDPLELRRSVGMVFQRPALFPGTVRDNLRVARPTGSDVEFAAMLARVGLEPTMLDRVGDELSGGEAQRMCIARALLTEPRMLLMDESTSSLDPDNRRGVESLTRALADAGIGVLWVGHDLEQAQRLADHLIVLVDGRIVEGDDRQAFLASGGER